MQERHVSVDKHTHELARPFMVLATQNLIEYEAPACCRRRSSTGSWSEVSLGYPSADDEADMLAAHAEHDRVLDLETVCEVGEVLAAQVAAARVHGSRRCGATSSRARRHAPIRGWSLRARARA